MQTFYYYSTVLELLQTIIIAGGGLATAILAIWGLWSKIIKPWFKESRDKREKLEKAVNHIEKMAENADFRLKVNVASISAAGDILAGVDRSPYLINYAQIIISNPDGQGWLNALSHGVVSNVAITDESSDGDIQFTLNSIFTKYAKAYYKIVD